MATTIYALCDPDLQVPVIRYIGKTSGPVKERFRQHRKTSSARHKNHLSYWLRSLKNRGESPVLMVLTEVPDEIGSAAEILYIRLAREGGMDLVNATDGGEGVTMTPEIRKKIGDKNRGLKRPLAQIEARRLSSLGDKNPMFGKHHTPEALAKNSAANRGTKRPNASSRYIGVFPIKGYLKWGALISVSGKRIWVGTFESEIDAAKAYDVAALRYYGPTAKLNFPVTCCGSGT